VPTLCFPSTLSAVMTELIQCIVQLTGCYYNPTEEHISPLSELKHNGFSTPQLLCRPSLPPVSNVHTTPPSPLTPPHERLASYAVVNATFLCGFFSFALLLSIVSEEVQSRLDVVRQGKLPVRAEGHTVILNW
jgi:hypothetical protein